MLGIDGAGFRDAPPKEGTKKKVNNRKDNDEEKTQVE